MDDPGSPQAAGLFKLVSYRRGHLIAPHTVRPRMRIAANRRHRARKRFRCGDGLRGWYRREGWRDDESRDGAEPETDGGDAGTDGFD